MQELIVLDTKVETGESEYRPPLVVCRPQKQQFISPQKSAPDETVQQTEFASEAEMTDIEEPVKLSEEPVEQPTVPPQVILPQQTARHRYGSLIRSVIALAVLGVTVWGYPKICPTVDSICSGIFRLTATSYPEESETESSEQQTLEEENKEEEASEQELTEQNSGSEQNNSLEQREEQSEQEIITQSVSAAQTDPVIGTIDNMTGDGKVKTQTLSASAGGIHLPLTYGLVKNLTEVKNSTLLQAAKDAPAFTLTDTDAPQVLIMHTHATESFLSAESDSFDTEASFRTKNTKENMVRIGDEITAVLKEAGIGVLHDTTLHDAKSYSGSYSRSAETVKNYLKKYPSIKIVLDIHRDAIGTKTEITAPTTTIDGRKAAQIMIISGCDDGTMDMPHYMDNFRFAAALQTKLEAKYPTLTRPILFDYRKYNQDLTTGSLLIEIGSNANTLDQAVYSGRLFASALAELCVELGA